MRKATGIIRRVDDLGRVVIPKELRRTLRIREGDPLEIYVDTTEGTIMLNKYSPVLSVAEIADDYANSIYESTGLSILVGDRDYVVAVAGARKKDYMNRTLSDLQATEVPVVFEEIKTYSTVDADGWIGPCSQRRKRRSVKQPSGCYSRRQQTSWQSNLVATYSSIAKQSVRSEIYSEQAAKILQNNLTKSC